MSSFSALEIGKRALLAQKFGLDVTSNNIANVNTPGYSRQAAVLSETSPINMSGQFLGTGVIADRLRNFRSQFHDREIQRNGSVLSSYASDEKLLKKVESILAEPSGQGLNEVVTKFFKGFDDISLHPNDMAKRKNLLDNAKAMTDRFRLTAQKMIDMRDDIRTNLDKNVDKANYLIKDIADLNKKIGQSKASTTIQAQTYVDQRANKLEELSELINISTAENKNGSFNVFVNGINVVTDQGFSQMEMKESLDSATGERTISLHIKDLNKQKEFTIDPQGGELQSQQKAYNVTLDQNDTSGGLSIMKEIDDYVNALVQKVNAATTGGYGLKDTGTTPPGRSFFTPTVGKATAANIKISQELLDDPSKIPLSDKAGADGNNTIARKIARIVNDRNFLKDGTPVQFYSELLSKVGNMSKAAVDGQKTTKLVSQQLDSQRESLIGVNLDEETISLVKFQKAFQASSRVISTTNEILGTIVNLGR